jgi:hypothetical protein
MQNLNYDELIARYPEVQKDRHGLSFGAEASPARVADALTPSGAVMLRSVLPERTLLRCQTSFEYFARSLGRRRPAWLRPWSKARDDGPSPQWRNGETDIGSWHSPWVVRYRRHRPAASILSALLKSWAWPVVEKICGATDIAILLGFCVARHAIDKSLGAGAHQDAKAVAAEVPFSMWIPFHAITPRRNSGLGFIVPAPHHVLPTLPHNDVGPDYVLGNLDKAWVPHYSPGDLTIHTSLSPHFTTGYGTQSDRYSLEIRAMARDASPPEYQDPAIYVGRRDSKPVIVDTKCSPGVGAHGFLASPALLG